MLWDDKVRPIKTKSRTKTDIPRRGRLLVNNELSHEIMSGAKIDEANLLHPIENDKDLRCEQARVGNELPNWKRSKASGGKPRRAAPCGDDELSKCILSRVRKEMPIQHAPQANNAD